MSTSSATATAAPAAAASASGEVRREGSVQGLVKNPLIDGVKNFGISATASAIGATAVYPIDLVKTRMQNQRKAINVTAGSSQAPLYTSSIDCFKKTFRNEGFFGLYKGLTPNLIGQVPEKAMRLFVVETVRKWATDKDADPNKVQLKAEILAGTAAGTCQVVITNPAEIVKVRLQVAGEAKFAGAGAPKTLGFVDVLRQLGFSGIYRGASACFLRDIPFSGLYFPIYAKMKEVLNNNTGETSVFNLLVSGTVAGVFASSLTTPADVIKTRLQVEPRPGELPYAGLRDCFWRVLKNEGISALFKGVGPRVIRSSPQYGVMLLAYEMLHMLLNGDEHILVEPSEVGQNVVVEDRWTVMNRWDPPPAFARDGRRMEKIAIGGQGNVWGLKTNHDVMKWTGFEWKKVGTSLDYISVGADGAAWGVRNNKIYRWDPWYSRFEEVSGPNLKKVSVGNAGKIWGISSDMDVFKFSHKGWKKRGDKRMKHVSVGADGTVWGIENDTNSVYCWQSKENEWKRMPGQMKQISVGGKNVVWGVNSNEELYHWVEEANSWVFISPEQKMKSVSVAADGTVLGLQDKTKTRLSGKIYA